MQGNYIHAKQNIKKTTSSGKFEWKNNTTFFISTTPIKIHILIWLIYSGNNAHFKYLFKGHNESIPITTSFLISFNSQGQFSSTVETESSASFEILVKFKLDLVWQHLQKGTELVTRLRGDNGNNNDQTLVPQKIHFNRKGLGYITFDRIWDHNI